MAVCVLCLCRDGFFAVVVMVVVVICCAAMPWAWYRWTWRVLLWVDTLRVSGCDVCIIVAVVTVVVAVVAFGYVMPGSNKLWGRALVCGGWAGRALGFVNAEFVVGCVFGLRCGLRHTISAATAVTVVCHRKPSTGFR